MGLHQLPAKRHGSRHSSRLRLAVPATLMLTHGTCPCLIDDISSTGARLRVSRSLAERQTLMLVFHELRLFAAVMWHRNGECGLKFDSPLEREDMEGMLWIRENRELYKRICEVGHAIDWSQGGPG